MTALSLSLCPGDHYCLQPTDVDAAKKRSVDKSSCPPLILKTRPCGHERGHCFTLSFFSCFLLLRHFLDAVVCLSFGILVRFFARVFRFGAVSSSSLQIYISYSSIYYRIVFFILLTYCLSWSLPHPCLCILFVYSFFVLSSVFLVDLFCVYWDGWVSIFFRRPGCRVRDS